MENCRPTITGVALLEAQVDAARIEPSPMHDRGDDQGPRATNRIRGRQRDAHAISAGFTESLHTYSTVNIYVHTRVLYIHMYIRPARASLLHLQWVDYHDVLPVISPPRTQVHVTGFDGGTGAMHATWEPGRTLEP